MGAACIYGGLALLNEEAVSVFVDGKICPQLYKSVRKLMDKISVLKDRGCTRNSVEFNQR